MANNTHFITSLSNDASLNLAAEEVLLRKHKENVIFLYINSPCIIVGKHQNTLSEINLEYIEKNNIPVFRRLSGGGTVYHDLGNINYCIIENGAPGQLVDFVKATTPIVEALKNYGIKARHGKRNDILAGFKKISGNACHIYKSRSMHHGTLLYNANITKLTEGLKADSIKFNDNSIKSVRSEVVNISSLSELQQTPVEFMEYIGNYLIQRYNATHYHFSDHDLAEIEKLKAEKYSTWNWNYGYSPTYEFSKTNRSDGYTFSSKIKVEKGVLSNIKITTNYPDKNAVQSISDKIRGLPHEKNAITQKMQILDKTAFNGIIQSLF
jgi:lipoate-protein ligase A